MVGTGKDVEVVREEHAKREAAEKAMIEKAKVEKQNKIDEAEKTVHAAVVAKGISVPKLIREEAAGYEKRTEEKRTNFFFSVFRCFHRFFVFFSILVCKIDPKALPR